MATPNFFRFYTAQNWQSLFYFVATDSTDHLSAKSGLTTFTVEYSTAGGGYLTWPGATVTPIGNGAYYFNGPALGPHSSTYIELLLKITATGMDPFFASLSIVAFNPGEPNRFNMACLPLALPGTSGGLLISGTTQHTVLTNANGNVAVYQNNDKTQYEITGASAQGIASLVWQQFTASYTTVGTFGRKLGDILADPWDISLPGAYGSGKAGRILGLNLDAAVSTRSDLNETDVANSVLAALDNANVEIGAVPAATAGLKQMIQFIFAYIKNKRTASSSIETLFKDDSTTPMGTASISDSGGTVTKGKMS